MQAFGVNELISAVSGQCLQAGQTKEITGAKIDSRKVLPGDLYIPIIGKNNDGHRFIEGAVDNGAAAVLVDANHSVNVPESVTVIQVASTFDAMKKLALANRKRFDIPVVAVTGSAGKTTTKDLIAAVLSQKFSTLKTIGNLNNAYGIPQTLFGLSEGHECAVVEMGMDHMGELTESIWEVLPHIAVITNIGSAHLENLGCKENTLKAKKEICSTLEAEDFCLVNGDDPYLRQIKDEKYSVVRVGINHEDVDLKVDNVTTGKSGIDFDVSGEHYHFKIPGIHNVYNCLMAIWIAREYGIDGSAVQRAFDEFVPSGNRMKTENIGEVTFIDDSYNANPESVRAAVNAVSDMCESENGRFIAVLGDMLEIGESGAKAHYDCGVFAASKADALIAVGEISRENTMAGFSSVKKDAAFSAKDAEEAVALLSDFIRPGDTVLIKASHGMALDRMIPLLKEAKS